MRMDRNLRDDGTGKYAVVNLRKLNACMTPGLEHALRLLEDAGALEWGRVGEPDEFFLVKLRDVFALGALRGYAAMAAGVDPEWSAEVRELETRAGINSPFCKHPD